MKRAQLVDYLQSHYKAPRMVLAAAGGVDHAHLVQLGEKYFGKSAGAYPAEVPALASCRFTGSEIKFRDDSMPYVYAAIAVEGVGWDHPDSLTLQLANLVGCSAGVLNCCSWSARGTRRTASA